MILPGSASLFPGERARPCHDTQVTPVPPEFRPFSRLPGQPGRTTGGAYPARWAGFGCFLHDFITDLPGLCQPLSMTCRAIAPWGGVIHVVSRAWGGCKSRVRSFCPHFYHGGSRRTTKRHGESLGWLLGELTARDFGLAIAVDWRSQWIGDRGPGMLEVFYCVSSGGTAAERAISQWSVVALALSPCIKNIPPDTHSTDEWTDTG